MVNISQKIKFEKKTFKKLNQDIYSTYNYNFDYYNQVEKKHNHINNKKSK